MTLTPAQTLIIIGMVTLGTVITRFLPFILFANYKKRPYITYLSQVLPFAMISLLVVYCLRDVDVLNPPFGLAEAIAIICIAALHYWKSNALVSIGCGTAVYMLLVQIIFV